MKEVSGKTIPEILFGEFSEGKVFSKGELYAQYYWANFKGKNYVQLELIVYKDHTRLRVAFGKVGQEDGKHDESSISEIAWVREGWRGSGTWGYGSGYKMRKAVQSEIRYYFGLELTSEGADAAIAVVNRAHDLAREYVVEEKWSGTCLEKP